MLRVTKPVIEAAEKTFKLAVDVSKCFDPDNINQLLKMCQVGGIFFGGASIVLGLASAFIPDVKHQEIMNEFSQVHSAIASVSNDIKRLESALRWESAKIQISGIVSEILLAIELCKLLGKNASNSSRKKDYETRLIELSQNQRLALAINTLLDGMTGSCEFSSNILEVAYSEYRGDRKTVSRIAGSLTVLLALGLSALMTYETIVRGLQSARDFEEHIYSGKRMADIKRCVSGAMQRCVDMAAENMLADLTEVMAQHHGLPNESVVDILWRRVNEKYDWLHTFCVIYNDLTGFQSHCFNGRRVEKLHYHGKCGIVFYRERRGGRRAAEAARKACDDVATSVSNGNPRGTLLLGPVFGVRCGGYIANGSAQTGCEHMRAEVLGAGVTYWGLGCWKRGAAADIWSHGAYPTGCRVWKVGTHFTTCVLLN